MASPGLFSYETCVHAVAGSTGSVIAMSVFYPLDTIKFRKQVCDSGDKDTNTFIALYRLLNKEGLAALYQGIKPVLISLGVSNFVYFYTFHGLKTLYKSSAKNDLGHGVLAGIANVLLTCPLWVVNSRLKLKKKLEYAGLFDGLVHVAKTEGVEGLWSSVGPSLVLVVNPALQFSVYEALKRRISSTSALSIFCMGAIAKMVATVVTYPIQLAQTRQRYNSQEGRMRMMSVLYAILKKGGISALFQGLEAKLWQTVLTAALMFVAYEKIVYYVFLVLMKKPSLK